MHKTLLMLLLLLPLALLLGGCETVAQKFENRALCTVDHEEMHVVSKWWRFGISAQIAQADARAICYAMELAKPVAAAAAADAAASAAKP